MSPPPSNPATGHVIGTTMLDTERLPLVDRPAGEGATRPLHLVTEGELESWSASLQPAQRAWVQDNGFRAERHRVLLLPATAGGIGAAVLGLGRGPSGAELAPGAVAGLTERLPNGTYALASPLPAAGATACALGFALGRYRFERYRRTAGPPREVRLVWPDGADRAAVRRLVEADALARDLINTPAEDMNPAALAAAIAGVAQRFGAQLRQWVGQELLDERCHAIHAVGRAAATAPRLVDLRWGTQGPRITIVGKGVCFDTGGLDLKPGAGMLLMKKDMGGAAVALALAFLVMDAGLPVQLRLLIPAVENAVSGNAFRPGDVLATRKGLTVEVGNTDAEGRLVLADALSLADEERPDLLLDLATLTGAARVALGPELPALFASDATLATSVLAAGRAAHDPLWELPLWAGYDDELASRVADLGNVSAGAFAGAIIGALFLRRFVGDATPWLHVDLYAWNPKDRPGRPVGAEAQALRALFRFLADRYPAVIA